MIQVNLLILIKHIISIIYNIEFPEPADVARSHLTEPNLDIIVTGYFQNRIKDPVEFKKKLELNILKEKKFSRLLKIMKVFRKFQYYYTYAKNFDINNHILIDKKQYQSYNEVLQQQHICMNEDEYVLDQPLWKMWIIQNYQQNQSAIIFKLHHEIGDGISLISFLLNSLELSNVKMLKLRKPNAFLWFFFQFVSIFYLPIVLFDQLKLKPEINKFKPESEPQRRKIKMFSSRQFDLSQIKDIKNKALQNSNINDIVLGLVIRTFQKYYAQKFSGEELNQISCDLAVGLRNIPTKQDIYYVNNQIIDVVLQFPVEKNNSLKEQILKYQEIFKSKLTIMKILATNIVFQLIPNILPHSIINDIAAGVINQCSFIYSSLPGPLEKIKIFNENEIEKFDVFAQGVRKLGLFAVLASYNNKISLYVSSEFLVKNFEPQEFVKKFEQIFDEEYLLLPFSSLNENSDTQSKKIM